MTDEAFSPLGPTEKFAAEQFRNALEKAQKSAAELSEALLEIDAAQIEDALIDSKRKETVLMLIDPLQKLAANLATSAMTPMLIGVLMKPTPAEAA